MRLTLLCLCGLVVPTTATPAAEPCRDVGVQHKTCLQTRINVEMGYLLYLPKDYEQQDSWPLVLFLHGAGERGNDLDLVMKHGPPKLIR